MTIAALRFNNPGNVSLPIQGYSGPGQIVGISGQPGYASFPTLADGLAAQRQRLANYVDVKGLGTIADLNTKYAEDPNWKNNVAKYSGIGINQPLDTSNQQQMDALQAGIIRQETGKDPSVFGFQPGSGASASTAPTTDGLGYGNAGVDTSVGTEVQSYNDGGGTGQASVVFGNGPSDGTGTLANGVTGNGIDASSFAGSFSVGGGQAASVTDGLPSALSGNQPTLDGATLDSGVTADSVAGSGDNIAGFNAAGPVQTNPAVVGAINQQGVNASKAITQGDQKIGNDVKTAGQTIGQSITTQSQSWVSWASDSLLRIFVLVIGIALFAGALYYFGKPAIDSAVAKVPKVIPV